jgi:hypothetical protein
MSWVLAVAMGVLVAQPDQPLADVTPRPERGVRLLSSPGCAMRALTRAFERRSDAVIACTDGERVGVHRARVKCSFNVAGAVVACETLASPKPTLSKTTLTCIEGALAAMKLDPKAGDPTQCQAQIEVSYFRKKYRRPQRYFNDDPDHPLNGL